ncbi:DODA-type extradiol aromatic ring-opening family dioxygenase [Comamonas terrigena]|uniref:DODA-type extradiol aromatic ring-opening family dioxygenase n=1 Tax=Comamonas terrigena TaxID=32013 RepID=UPI002352B9A8|nr:class III extradiol ring-cleavage dioxygenase [Comamonas terrigena]
MTTSLPNLSPTADMPVQRLPALFVSHGSPMFAVEPGDTGPALQRWGSALRAEYSQLRGVVVMSPHWMSRGLEVMAALQPETWHDFGGFPRVLYSLQYPAPGAPLLAQQVAQLLQAAGQQPMLNPERPMDHGAWVPLMHLFPQADVPVVQLSLPADADAAAVYALGQALRPLRDAGVLLVGSGSMTHNLRDFVTGQSGGRLDYVQPFSRWIEERITARDTAALLDWLEQAPQARRAHPTDDHFLPLFFALGAGGPGTTASYLSREVQYGMLAMDSFALQDVPAGEHAAASSLQ